MNIIAYSKTSTSGENCSKHHSCE